MDGGFADPLAGCGDALASLGIVAVLRRAFAPTKKTGLLSETGLPAFGYATRRKLCAP